MFFRRRRPDLRRCLHRVVCTWSSGPCVPALSCVHVFVEEPHVRFRYVPNIRNSNVLFIVPFLSRLDYDEISLNDLQIDQIRITYLR